MSMKFTFFRHLISWVGCATYAPSICGVERPDRLFITSATASTGSESQLHSLVLLWLLFGPAEWHFLLPLVDFVPMTGVYLPADQATMRVYTSREPEDPEFTVDSILPFLGLGATECDLNLPMQTSLQTYVCPALESAESKWIPWDTTLDNTFRLHLLVCERELFISICNHARFHTWMINLGGGHPVNRLLTYYCNPPLKSRFYPVITRLTTQLRYNRNSITCVLKL